MKQMERGRGKKGVNFVFKEASSNSLSYVIAFTRRPVEKPFARPTSTPLTWRVKGVSDAFEFQCTSRYSSVIKESNVALCCSHSFEEWEQGSLLLW